jgi:TfoX/Sxy family transcriptional regulator of competence genes
VAYSSELAEEIRFRIGEHPALTEKEMFGGIAFMVCGNMAVGVSGNELMVRVGKEAHDEAVALPGARIFDLSSRPMRGWIVVGQEGIATDTQLEEWIQRGISFAETLPPK